MAELKYYRWASARSPEGRQQRLIRKNRGNGMKKENIEELEPFTAEEEYVEYQNDMQSQLKKDLEEASA